MISRPDAAPAGRSDRTESSIASAASSRWGIAPLALVAGSAVGTIGTLGLAARVMARMPLIPSGRQKDDAVIRAVLPDRVHLDATAETVRPGVLAVRQGGGAVNVRLGPVTHRPTPTTVARNTLAVDAEDPAARLDIGPAGTNGFYWSGDPRTAHGLVVEEIDVPGPVGPLPAWLVPGAGQSAHGGEGTWAIIVHGHGATRGEALRLLPLLHRLGLTSLTVTYRNDLGAPASADRMMHLGSAEWEDVDAAIRTALERGARDVVLIGLSMGGGIALRTAVLSEHRERIAALVLDSPAIDWRDILEHHAKALRAPRPLRELALWMMRSGWGARSVRLHEPIALAQMQTAFYAEHLETPTLLIHALRDATVPPAPSAALAHLRPDVVEFVPFEDATHTREWNTDPERYERLVARFLSRTLDLGIDADALDLPVRAPAAPAQARSSGRRL